MKLFFTPGNFIIQSLEKLFKRWGHFVSRNPYPIIVTCLVLTALGGIGWINFRLEHKANKLWIPENSSFNLQKDWLDANFPTKNRLQMVLIKSDNILTPESLQKMFQLHQSISSISVQNKTFQDICTRVPIADIFQTKRRRKREAFITENSKSKNGQNISDSDTISEYDYDYIWSDYDYKVPDEEEHIPEPVIRIDFSKYGDKDDQEDDDLENDLPDDIYCDLVENLKEKCGEQNLLEIWRYREDLIASSTQQEIIDAVNLLVSSPWYGHNTDYTSLLGGITRNHRIPQVT